MFLKNVVRISIINGVFAKMVGGFCWAVNILMFVYSTCGYN